jgi:hypothetical protein
MLDSVFGFCLLTSGTTVITVVTVSLRDLLSLKCVFGVFLILPNRLSEYVATASSNLFPITRHDLYFMSNTSSNIKLNTTCHMFSLWFLLSLFFDPEDGGDMLLRNVG